MSAPRGSLVLSNQFLDVFQDEDDLANALIWPEIQQELKIIESEEELSSLPPPALQIGATPPILESSPGPFASPEPPGSLPCGSAPAPVSAPLEEWTKDPTNQIGRAHV